MSVLRDIGVNNPACGVHKAAFCASKELPSSNTPNWTTSKFGNLKQDAKRQENRESKLTRHSRSPF
jgi:hypothetical protein